MKENIIIIAILVIILGLSALYIYKAKKSGKKCIGCPEKSLCSKGSCSSCSCCCQNDSTEN